MNIKKNSRFVRTFIPKYLHNEIKQISKRTFTPIKTVTSLCITEGLDKASEILDERFKNLCAEEASKHSREGEA